VQTIVLIIFSFKKLDIHYSKNVRYTFKIRYYLPNSHEKKALWLMWLRHCACICWKSCPRKWFLEHEKSFHNNEYYDPFYEKTKKGHNRNCKHIENNKTNRGFEFPFFLQRQLHAWPKQKENWEGILITLAFWVFWKSWKLIYCSDEPAINCEKNRCQDEYTD